MISFITSITAITHAQDNPQSCMGGGCYPSTPPQETPNRGGPTENTTSDVASNSTKCTTAEQHTGSTP